MDVNVRTQLGKNIERRYIKYSPVEIQSIGEIDGLVVGDAIAPSCFVHDIPMPTNAVFISESIGGMFGGHVLPFESLLAMLNVKMADIKKSLLALKKKEMNLVLIGYGGYSINTLDFLYRLCIKFGITDLFNHISIFESDNITFSNIMRIYPTQLYMTPVDNTPHKFGLIKESYDGVLSSDINCVLQNFDAAVYTEYYKDKDVVYLGAPDFDTRMLLVNEKFLFGGHAGDEVALISRPLINAELTTESYGTINPTTLLLNLLRAAVELPAVLCATDFPENQVLFDYNVKEAYRKGELKTSLNFLFKEEVEQAPCGTETCNEENE